MPVALIIQGLASLPALIAAFEGLAQDAKRSGRLSPEEDAALAASLQTLQDVKTKPSWWLTDAERVGGA